ncbi:hypothetical protein HOO68_04315, partial [Candidatus Gracilibacteria bacterium]|nr:hypothetical protein [Candidatus Gracilibacteria bacterium]
WTHSGILLAELTGSGISGSTYTGILVTPRDAILYISNLFDQSTNIIHDFVALQVTAVHGYFSEVWTEKVNTNEICFKKSNGIDVCLNGDQVELLLANIAQSTPITQVVPTFPTTNTELTPVSTSTGTTDSRSTLDLTSAPEGNNIIIPTDSGSVVPTETIPAPELAPMVDSGSVTPEI